MFVWVNNTMGPVRTRDNVGGILSLTPGFKIMFHQFSSSMSERVPYSIIHAFMDICVAKKLIPMGLVRP